MQESSCQAGTDPQPTKPKMKTTYGTQIDKILSVYDNIALCLMGCEIVHIHTSNIIGR
jgi:hypothetical protein